MQDEVKSFQHSVDNMVVGILYVYMAQGVLTHDPRGHFDSEWELACIKGMFDRRICSVCYVQDDILHATLL